MEIILKEKISKLGNIGEVVTVKDGFAKNFLIPKGKALCATTENKKTILDQKSKLEELNNKLLEQSKASAQDLNGKAFIFIRNAGENGQLYGSVSSKDIIDSLAKGGVDVNVHQIKFSSAIKNIGVYDVSIELHPETIISVYAIAARSVVDAEQLFNQSKKDNKTSSESEDLNPKKDSETRAAGINSETNGEPS